MNTLTLTLVGAGTAAGALLPYLHLAALRRLDRAAARRVRRRAARAVGDARSARDEAVAVALKAAADLTAARAEHADRLASRDLEVGTLALISEAVRPAGRERLFGYPVVPHPPAGATDDLTATVRLPRMVDTAPTDTHPVVPAGGAA